MSAKNKGWFGSSSGGSSMQYMKLETSDTEEEQQEHKLSTIDTEPLEKPTRDGAVIDYRSPILDATVKKIQVISDHYALEKAVLGKGSSAMVVTCTNKHTGERLACKMISKENLSPRQRHRIFNEVKIHTFLSGHPHVVKLIDVCEGDEFVYMIMELCKGGNLLELLHQVVAEDGISEPKAAEIIVALAEVLSFCHKNGIVHRDIKPENILLHDHYPQNKTATIKLADFGNAFQTSSDHARTHFLGTNGYIAPEMLRNENYGPAIDIWSVGVVLCNLLTGQMPYWFQDHKKLVEGRATINFDKNENWNAISLNARSLIRGMLHLDPAQRLNADEILSKLSPT